MNTRMDTKKTTQNNPQILPVGDRGLTIVLGDCIAYETHQKINQLCQRLEQERIEGILEWVPTYGALLVAYEPEVVLFEALAEKIEKLMAVNEALISTEAEVVTLPVCYGGEYGLDLAFVAAHTKLSEAEVVARHVAGDYLIYMLGFTPGFPYLGGMDETLETPRLKTPRTKIPAGAVGIAGKQTGVYPSSSPGGWQLIGQTPLKLFDPFREQPFLLKAGQRLRFEAIDEVAYKAILAEQESVTLKAGADGSVSGKAVESGEFDASAGAEMPSVQTASLQIENAGLLTTIQDTGRYGFRQYGVSVGGVMDAYAARTANWLVGNLETAAVLEMTYLGVAFVALKSVTMAYTGAHGDFKINGQLKPMDRSHVLQAGDRVQIGAFTKGVRGYLAFSGGVICQKVMNSYSTDLRGGFGGYEGRGLKVGDLLLVGGLESANRLEKSLERKGAQKLIGPSLKTMPEGGVRVILGPQSYLFSQADLNRFTESVYRVTKDSDRMGMRLDGETLSPEGGGDILSDGIVKGAVQVAGHGSPMVMLADCQTTGGYAKIAQVISIDLPLLAQLKPDDSLEFQWIDLEMAQELYMQERQAALVAPVGRQMRLSIEGHSFEVEVEEVLL